MQTYLSRAQLKDNAKNTLAGHYGLLIGSSLLIGLITLLVNLFVTSLIPSISSLPGIVISVAVSFLISVFANIFNVGVSLMYLKYASGHQASLADIFYGFSNRLETSLKISFVLTAVNSVSTFAWEIPYRMYLLSSEIRYLYMAVFLGIVTLFICIPLNLTFYQSFYIMLDFPDKPAREVLASSAHIMSGKKLRLFVLELSFLPILLLSAISCVGLLWVGPYMQMTFAHFYFDIMKPGR